MNKKNMKNKTLITIVSIFVVALFIGTSVSTVLADPSALSADSDSDSNDFSSASEAETAAAEEKAAKEREAEASSELVEDESASDPAALSSDAEEASDCPLCYSSANADSISADSVDELTAEEREILEKAIAILSEHDSALKELIEKLNLKDLSSSDVSELSMDYEYYELVGSSDGSLMIAQNGQQIANVQVLNSVEGSPAGQTVVRQVGILPAGVVGGMVAGGEDLTNIDGCLRFCAQKAINLAGSLISFAKGLIPAFIKSYQELRDWWNNGGQEWVTQELIPAVVAKAKQILKAAFNVWLSFPGLTTFIAGVAITVGTVVGTAIAAAITAAIAKATYILTFPGVKLQIAGILFGICTLLKDLICNGDDDSATSSYAATTYAATPQTITTQTSVATQTSTASYQTGMTETMNQVLAGTSSGCSL